MGRRTPKRRVGIGRSETRDALVGRTFEVRFRSAKAGQWLVTISFNRPDQQAANLSRARCFCGFLLCRNLGDRYHLLVDGGHDVGGLLRLAPDRRGYCRRCDRHRSPDRNDCHCSPLRGWTWRYAIGNVVALILATFNMLVHTRDAWTSVVPWGLVLSVAIVVVLILTGWMTRETYDAVGTEATA